MEGGVEVRAEAGEDVEDDRPQRESDHHGDDAGKCEQSGDRTAEELARGALEQVLIKGARGYILMTHAGKEAVVTVLAKPNARLGLIFLDVKRAAENIGKII